MSLTRSIDFKYLLFLFLCASSYGERLRVASYNVKNDLPTVVLGTAHPYKFADTIKMAINKDVVAPEQIASLPDKKEKFDIVDRDLKKVKNYILEKTK